MPSTITALLSLESATLLYFSLPFFIFFFGWLKLPVAMVITPLFTITLFFSLQYFKNQQQTRKKTYSIREELKQHPWITTLSIIVIIATITLWVTLSGSGRFFLQNGDYHKHNAVLNDLVSMAWPVAYQNLPLYEIASENYPYKLDYFYLVYYLAYYLPAALIGKIFADIYVANHMLFLWTIFGALLAIAWIFRLIGKLSMLAPCFFILFSGLDFIGLLFNPDPKSKNVESILKGTSHIEWWAGYGFWQYSSSTACLFWTPHHFITAWVLTAFLLYWFMQKEQTTTSSACFSPFPFIYSLSAFWSPFVMIGLAPFLLLSLFHHPLKQLFHWKSILLPLLLLLTIALFYQGNLMKHPQGFFWDFLSPTIFWPRYLLFCFLEFGVYALLIWPLFRQGGAFERSLYAITIILLILLPLYKLGYYNDFTMRVSLPALFVLQLLVWKFLSSENFKQDHLYPIKVMIVMALFLGSFTPLQEISRSIAHSEAQFEFTNVPKTFKGSQFMGHQNSLFFEYLGKSPPPTNISITKESLDDLFK
ncbi:MAG: hypothetical protein HQK50_13885 [Oligoflexia bacterium]|nr:hypothetical protein [Oligoflexia bacterium]MBF0366659.1 hypothetical protein [Oligoflexia bacterium]